MAWQPGESGNPNGRPKKGQTLTDLMKQDLEAIVEIKHKDGTIEKVPQKVLFVRSVILKALAGDSAFAKMVMEYVDGKPITKILEGKLDIVESEEWGAFLRLMIILVEKHPDIKDDVDEMFRHMDDTERSGRVLDEALAVDSGQDTECGTEIEGETDNMQLSSAVGKVDHDSDQGTAPSEVPTGTTDLDSVADGEAEPGAIPEDIREVESDTETEED